LVISKTGSPSKPAPPEEIAYVEIDWIKITGKNLGGGVAAQKKKQKLNFDKQIGKPGESFIRVDGEKVHLENKHYICELSLEYGLKWSRMFNKAIGKKCLSKDDNNPVFMLVGKDLSLDSDDFAINDVTVVEKGGTKRLELLLTNAERKLDCVVAVKIDSSDKMLWSLKIKNDSTEAIKLQPVFPILSRLNIGGDMDDTDYFFPWRTGVVGSVDCDLAHEYGGLAWMQVISVFNPRLQGGVYTYPKDGTGIFKGLLFKKASSNPIDIIRHTENINQFEMPRADILEFDEGAGLAYYYLSKEIAAAEELALPETVVSIYRGTWKEPLKDYSTWAHTWYKHVDTPQWFKDCYNVICRHPFQFYSKEKKKYIVSDELLGNEDVFQWAFWHDHQDRDDLPFVQQIEKFQAGDFEYHKQRGGLKAFKEEIEQIQNKGFRFTIYINHRFCFYKTKTGQKHAKEWAAVYDPGGKELATHGGPNDKYVMCFYEPNAWADYIAQTCGRIVRDTGMDGIYLDELALPRVCYNLQHTHNRERKNIMPLDLFVQHIKNARDAMRKENPEAILMTEHAGSDYFSQFYDGSWTQTFCMGFPFSEKHFDENSLIYFRFCFPEFKLAAWGALGDGQHRTFFNGIGFDFNNGNKSYSRKVGQVFKENGDAFASLKPEPLIETKVKKVLANKFPTAEKTVYTVYNKNEKPINAVIMEVDAKQGYHFVEMVYDEEVKSALNPSETKQALKLQIKADDVICIGRLPQIIQTIQQDGNIIISLKKNIKDARLVAYLDKDTSGLLDDKDARPIELTEGLAIINPEKLFGRKGKLILKLMQGNHLLDEVITEF